MEEPKGNNNIRRDNGAQGALWGRISSYYNAFPGELSDEFKTDLNNPNTAYYDWTQVPKALNIDAEASDYKAMLGTAMPEGVTIDTSSYKWTNSGNYYIIRTIKYDIS